MTGLQNITTTGQLDCYTSLLGAVVTVAVFGSCSIGAGFNSRCGRVSIDACLLVFLRCPGASEKLVKGRLCGGLYSWCKGLVSKVATTEI